MVYLLGGCKLAVLAALLAQRVGCDIPVSDAFPRTAITFFGSGVALVLFIPLRFLLFMDRAEPAIRQLRTAGITARSFWSLRQVHHLPEREKTLGALHSKGQLNKKRLRQNRGALF
jgi:hypothetical protein